jgi:hypothetical protein
MTGNTDMHLMVTDTKNQKTSQYLSVASCSMISSLHRVDQDVDCCLWNVVRLLFNGCAYLLDIGKLCRTRWSRASQTCSVDDMSGEYTGHERPGTFSATSNCVQILTSWGCALSCWNMMQWWRINGPTMGLRISSQYFCAFKLPSIKLKLCSLSVAYALPIP